MTVPASTIPTLTAWLVTRLTANITAATGADILVRFGPAGENEPDDMVLVSTGRRQVAPFVLTGDMQTMAMQETYELTIKASVARGGDDFLAAEARMWAIVAGIEATVRTDLYGVINGDPTVRAATLGGAVFRVEVGDHTPSTDWSPNDLNDVIAEIDYPIVLHAQI